MPIISQWPVVVSIPGERSRRRPHTDGASGRGRQPRSGMHVPEAERLHRRHLEAADGLSDVRERRGAGRAEGGGVGQVARADRVQHDDACAVAPAYPTGRLHSKGV